MTLVLPIKRSPCHTASQDWVLTTREYPLTPWYLSHRNQYVAVNGHHHPWSFQLVYAVDQLTGSILSPFCHIPIDSVEVIWPWFSTLIFWYKVNYQDNTVMVCIFTIESHMQKLEKKKRDPYFSQSTRLLTLTKKNGNGLKFINSFPSFIVNCFISILMGHLVN